MSVMCDVLVSRRRLVLGGALESIRCGCDGRPRGQLTGRVVSHDPCLREDGITHEGDKEENDVDYAEREAGLEHGATLVHIDRESVVVLHSKVSERAQIQVYIIGASREVCTAGIGDSS